MKKLLFLGCAIIFATTLHAQQLDPQVIAADGSCYIDPIESKHSLSWTLGEIVTQTFTSSGMTLEQGFHHGNLVVTGLQRDESFLPGFSVYPNPSENFINIDFGRELESTLQLEIIDMKGTLYLQKKVPQGMSLYEADLSGLAQGTYFLRLKSKDKPYNKTHQIIKTSN